MAHVQLMVSVEKGVSMAVVCNPGAIRDKAIKGGGGS